MTRKMLTEYEGYKKRVKIDKRCWDEEDESEDEK